MPSRTLVFVGVDPGQKGAACLLGVLDDQDGKRHGAVVYVAVWDHVLRQTGESTHADPVHYAEMVRHHAIAAGAAERDAVHLLGAQVPVARVIVELPSVQGKFGKFNAGSIITQGANYGVLLGASLVTSEFEAELVELADAAGGRWYTECGVACPKGTDRKEHSVAAAQALVAQWTAAGARVDLPRDGITIARNDRADSVLLAHLGVLRWLGRAAVPADAGRTASTKARAKAARDHEIKRAMEGTPRGMKGLHVACPVEYCAAPAGMPCTRSKSSCRERLWFAAPTMKTPHIVTDMANLGAFMETVRKSASGYCAISLSRGVWRVTTTHGIEYGTRIERDALDAAIDAGLVYFMLDAKRRPVWVTTFREASAPAAAVQQTPPC